MKKNPRQKRIEIIQKIEETIRQGTLQDKPINYEKLIAVLCLDEGLSRRTIREYIDILIKAERVVLIDGEITTNQKV